MKPFPDSKIYEQEFEFMPWRILIKEILEIIEKEVPEKGSVLDLMCGPGHLLGKIADIRSDLNLEGVDISEEFVQYAKSKYPNISFQIADVLSWNPKKKYDLILCTGGLHHLPYDKQKLFLERIPDFLSPNGFAIFADSYIDDFSNESERKQAAAKLGYEYLVAVIKNNAPDEIIEATVDIFYNDVMGFECKTSIKKLEPFFKKLFSQVEINKTWPDTDSGYGDYYIVCKNAK